MVRMQCTVEFLIISSIALLKRKATVKLDPTENLRFNRQDLPVAYHSRQQFVIQYA
jgi:hypothetical protein